MLVKSIAVLTVLFAAPSALAASRADLATSITTSPSPALVYATARYTVRVANVGNRNASGCTVHIDLPATHTSPQVYVLGDVGGTSSACTQNGTALDCPPGTINKGKNKSVYFDIALPVNAASLDFTATAATTSSENDLGNNSASAAADQTFYAAGVATTPSTPATMVNSHCTGTGLTAWYECTLSPSSITAHVSELHDDGTLTIPGYAGYTGGWTLTPTSVGSFLYFNMNDGSGIVAEFEGWGVDGGCFEGLTTFPGGGAWVSPYEVCPQ